MKQTICRDCAAKNQWLRQFVQADGVSTSESNSGVKCDFCGKQAKVRVIEVQPQQQVGTKKTTRPGNVMMDEITWQVVVDMRQKQREYFHTRSTIALREAKKLERKLDAIIKHKNDNQPGPGIKGFDDIFTLSMKDIVEDGPRPITGSTNEEVSNQWLK